MEVEVDAHGLRPDIYLSVDVETDGSIPGPYSMLSFGISLVGSFDGDRFERVRPGERTLYRELKPISSEFDPGALEVNGLDRELLKTRGVDPHLAMEDAGAWVEEVADGGRPILIAYPVAFDWSFMYWYFERFRKAGSPFGHSSCLDIRTLYQAVSGTVFDASAKDRMPGALQPQLPHTHNALDDAVEQGELFANLFAWALRRKGGAIVRAWGDSNAMASPAWLEGHISPFVVRKR